MSITSQIRKAIQAAAEKSQAAAGTSANVANVSTQDAQKALTAANQKKWWKTNFPWASSLNAAQHIDYFLTNPKSFVNDVLNVYDSLDSNSKVNYAADIAGYMSELNINNNSLLQEKLALIPVGPLGQFTVKIWPELTDYFWLRWANEDINAFLNEHLKNLAAIPQDQRGPHIEYFRNWINKTGTTDLINSAGENVKEKFIAIMSPEGITEVQAAAIASDSPGAKLLIGGLLIGGILWGVTAFTKKKKR